MSCPQKQKLGLEEKVEIIQDYLEGTISKSEAARRGGVTRDTIEQWARNYEADGADAFLLHKNRVYTPELKRQAVEDYLSGVGSQSEICKKYHIRKRMQLQKWIQVYNAHGDFNSVKFSEGGSYMRQRYYTLSFGTELMINPTYRQVSLEGNWLNLTRKEFDLLYFLASSPGQVFTREQIYRNVWHGETDYHVDEAVKSSIKALRKKLNPASKEYIENVRGVGYRFVVR